MQTENIVVKSEFDGLDLHVTVKKPQGEIKGIFQILHGMAEFRERYEELENIVCQQGYIAVCHDHRGHGDSVKKIEDRGYFYDTSAKAIVEDCVCVTKKIQELYPNLPVVLFGHSMGSMIARCYLQEHDDLLEKAIICGTPKNNPLSGFAIALTNLIILFKGDKHRSRFLAYAATGHGNNRFKGEGKGAWLSHDRENIEWFYNHPKGRNHFTCNGFLNLFKLMRQTFKKKAYCVQNSDLPILFISGSEDAVLGGEKAFEKTVNALKKVGYTSVCGKLYEGMRHEIHNDLKKQETFQDILSFLENGRI